MDAQILTISSKGQISIPTSFRRNLSLNTGDKLVAFASGDVIMLKTLRLPSENELKASLDEAQRWAASEGYVAEDVDSIIKEVRSRKK